MLLSVKELTGYGLEASDGSIGEVRDFLFEFRKDLPDWSIRYLAADTRAWLPGKTVLLAPQAFEDPRWKHKSIPVHLTRLEIRESPSINEDPPLSREMESRIHVHYGWSPYWPVNPVADPVVATSTATLSRNDERESAANSYLRSSSEVMGYRIEASDGDVGHVEDFIVDTESWIVRYIVVDTRNWLPGRKVLVHPDWVNDIEWSSSSVRLNLPKERIKNSPEFDPGEPVNRRYEERLFDFYGRPKYWSG